MRYLDITTYKQSSTKDSDNHYPETDHRVAHWFKTPIGFDVEQVLGDFPLLVELSPINEDGTVNTHKRAILDSLETTESGEYYKYYLADGTPDLEKIQAEQAEVLEAEYISALEAHMDAKAKEKGYDSIKTAVTYADEPIVQKYQEEGTAFRAWRSKVYAYVYEQLDLVQSGDRDIPTIDELIAELPDLVI